MPLVRKNPSDRPPAPPIGPDPFERLRTGTKDERWAAARALATAPGGAAALGAALGLEADARVREAIFTSLARMASAQSVEAVLPHLRAPDPGLRTATLDALRAMPQAAAIHLPTLLADADADVRLLSCEIVRHLPADLASRLMCDVLDRETAVNVCAAAVEVLAEIASPETLPVLARCAARFPDERFLGFAIKAASDRIGSAQPRD